MATAIIRNLSTSEERSYADFPERGASNFNVMWRKLRIQRDMLNRDEPGPWVIYLDGEGAPNKCPHCGATGPFS